MSLTQKDIPIIKELIKQEAAKMLHEVIQKCYSYNAERREDPTSNGGEIHYRTLELLNRYAEDEFRSEYAWIKYHEIENETNLYLGGSLS